MHFDGRCRLCNGAVASYNVNRHLLDCKRIRQYDTDDFAHEYADITNNSYHDIINVVYDNCDCIMHDDEISHIFRKVSTFSKFLYDLEHLLDRKATFIFKKMELSGQCARFNILNYS